MNRVRAPATVCWAANSDDVVVIDVASSRSCELDSLQGAVWELIDRHGVAVATGMMCHIGDWSFEEANAFVAECIRTWVQEGLLMSEERDAQPGDHEHM